MIAGLASGIANGTYNEAKFVVRHVRLLEANIGGQHLFA
jgi:hypothetical protein